LLKFGKRRLGKQHSFRFTETETGEVKCPLCFWPMVELDIVPQRSRHWLCEKAGLVFFGDEDGISVCFHPDEDCKGLSLSEDVFVGWQKF
jgi:hypothetical protein